MINWNLKKIFAPAFEKKKDAGPIFENDVAFAQNKLITEDISVFDTYASKLRMVICAAIFMLSLFIQEGFFNNIRLFGAKPEFAVVVVFIVAFMTELRVSMIFGVAAGLYVDIVYGRFLGFYGILLMYAAVVASLISKIPGKEKENHKGSRSFMFCTAPIFFLIYTACESFIAKIMLMYTNSSMEFYADYGEHFLVKILPVVAYDFIVFAVVVWPMVAIWKRAGKKKMM